jgi:hypothetical protein
MDDQDGKDQAANELFSGRPMLREAPAQPRRAHTLSWEKAGVVARARRLRYPSNSVMTTPSSSLGLVVSAALSLLVGCSKAVVADVPSSGGTSVEAGQSGAAGGGEIPEAGDGGDHSGEGGAVTVAGGDGSGAGAAGEATVGQGGSGRGGAASGAGGSGTDGRGGSASGGTPSGGSGQAGEGEGGGVTAGGEDSGGAASGGSGTGGRLTGGAGQGGTGRGGALSGGSPDLGGALSGGSAGLGGEVIETSCDTETHACVPEIPAGWQGPLVVVDGEAYGACDALTGYGLAEGFTGGQQAEGDLTCACDCSEPTGVECGNKVTHRVYGGDACTGAVVDSFERSSADCSAGGVLSMLRLKMTVAAPTLSCAEGVYPEAPPESAAWSATVRGCMGSFTTEHCAESGTVCVELPPSAANGDLCVMREEETTCPAGYPARTVYYRDYDDRRRCPTEPCACDAQAGVCEASFSLFSSASCQEPPLEGTLTVRSDESTVCLAESDEVPEGEWSYQLTGIEPLPGSSTCVAGVDTTVDATGTVEPTSPVTVCCVAL